MVCSPPVVSKCLGEAHRRLGVIYITLHYIKSFLFFHTVGNYFFLGGGGVKHFGGRVGRSDDQGELITDYAQKAIFTFILQCPGFDWQAPPSSAVPRLPALYSPLPSLHAPTDHSRHREPAKTVWDGVCRSADGSVVVCEEGWLETDPAMAAAISQSLQLEKYFTIQLNITPTFYT